MRRILLIAMLAACAKKKGDAPPAGSASASPTPARIASPAPRVDANVAPAVAPDAAAPPEVPAIEVTAQQLFSAYKANEISADAKYRDRELLVSGRIARIGKDALDNPMLELATTNEFMSVVASFASEAGLGALQRRQPITVRCRGAGMTVGSPMLKGCTIEQTKEHIARSAAINIATVVYDMWKADNPKATCPKSIAEIMKYLDVTHDPWGQAFRIGCNPSAPADKRMRAQSNGPDQKPDTSDDIKSWD